MEEERQIYLFMNDKQFSFCLYRIGESQLYAGDRISSIRLFDKPLLEMDKSMFPESMCFTTIRSRIFMVGGLFDGCPSNKVFIYDTLSSTMVPGPLLNSGKLSPYLFTFGSKIFALSHLMYTRDDIDYIEDHNPRFEMLDTDDPEPKWSPLPNPVLHVSLMNNSCCLICATAAVYVDGSPVIFISADDGGTYAFEVDKLVWNYVSAEILPLAEDAVTIPHAPSMCCGGSLNSKRFAAFRFFYEGNGKGFGYKEIPVYGSENLPPLGPPLLVSQRSLPIVFGPDNRVYFISTGVDEAASYSSALGNRYVTVYALDFEGIDLNVPRSLKRRRNKKQIGHDKDQGERMGHDEKQVETAEVVLNKGQLLESSKKKKEKSRNGNNEEQDETTKVNLSKGWLNKCGNKKSRNGNDEEEDETTKVNLSKGWLNKCGNKKSRNGNDEEEDETTKVNLSKGWLNKCGNKKSWNGNDEEEDETTKVNLSKGWLNKCGNKKREMEVEEVTIEEYKLINLWCEWGECFFGGPAVDGIIHVLAAIAM